MTPASACLGKGNKVAMTARANTVERRIRPPQAPNQAKLAVARGTAYDISATVHDYLRTGSTSNGAAPGAAAAIAFVRLSPWSGARDLALFQCCGADPRVRAGQRSAVFRRDVGDGCYRIDDGLLTFLGAAFAIAASISPRRPRTCGPFKAARPE